MLRAAGRWIWLVAVSLGLLSIPAPARHTGDGQPPALSWFALDETAVPGDEVLHRQIEDAVDLRERERFDRVLDGRDPGELVEHATLTDGVLDRHLIGIDALKIVGDELFGYPFRPE